jgi:hypothetical protein
MAEHAEATVVRNLMEALHRLHDDLDRVEVWTAALSQFQHPAPEYQAGTDHLLPAKKSPPPGHA